MDLGIDPTKVPGSDKRLVRLAQTMDGWAKEDPPTLKKLPVEADVPELLVKLGLAPCATELVRATGDLSLIAFYFLLRIGEYTGKGARMLEKQTEQFTMGDTTFFSKDENGKIRQISRLAPDDVIMSAASGTLTLGNQKNGWKGASIHHESTGDPVMCPIRALGRRFCHIRRHMKGEWKTPLSAYYTSNGTRSDVSAKDISSGLKSAAALLNYPSDRGIPIERIDTHSLRSGGANALSLAGYSDTQIQKMGRWKGKTFKEYIREELHNFSEGMSRAMKKVMGFVNISGGVYHDVTATVTTMEYDNAAPAA